MTSKVPKYFLIAFMFSVNKLSFIGRKSNTSSGLLTSSPLPLSKNSGIYLVQRGPALPPNWWVWTIHYMHWFSLPLGVTVEHGICTSILALLVISHWSQTDCTRIAGAWRDPSLPTCPVGSSPPQSSFGLSNFGQVLLSCWWRPMWVSCPS